MIRASLLPVALFCALSTGTVHADEGARPRIAMTVLVGSDCPRTWYWEVRAALRRLPRVVPRAIPTGVRAADAVTGARDRLRAATSAAEQSFRQADFGQCVLDAVEAERDLVGPLAEAGMLRELSPLLALAAACELKRGATEVAHDRLRLALALDPSLTFDPARFPPDVAGPLDQARRETSAAPRHEVRLTPSVADARVEVDGQRVSSPARLAAGPHYVMARAPGARTLVRPLLLAGQTEVDLGLEPLGAEAARTQLASGLRSADLTTASSRLAAIAGGTTYVVSVRAAAPRPGGQRVELTLHQVVGLEVSALGTVQARAPHSARGWSTLLAGVHPLLRGRAAPAQSSSGAVPWWLWAAGAAVAVAAGTAITLALLPDEPDDSIRLRPGGLCFSPDQPLDQCLPWTDD